MRIPLLVAALALLVAGCSPGGGDGAAGTLGPSLTPLTGKPRVSATTPSSTTTTTTTPSTSATPTAAPAPGSPIGAVAAWIDAGTPVEAGDFHSATRDGEMTPLPDGVAFSLPGGAAKCMTDPALGTDSMSCLLTVSNPLPQPIGQEGHWVPGWVDYDGGTVLVGALRADPGPFGAGAGPELSYGSALKFGDFRCRADQTGLFCMNYARQTAVRLSADGVTPFGCLQRVDAPVVVGAKYGC